MQKSAIHLSPYGATKTENDQAVDTPTPSEIRITAGVIRDVIYNSYTWDMAITRAAAMLDIPRAAVAHSIKRTREWFMEDDDTILRTATTREP